MKLTHLTVPVGGVIALGLALAVRVVSVPLVVIPTLPLADAHAARATVAQTAPVDSVGAVLVRRDPFRITRHSAGVAYDPQRGAQPPAPAAPKPVLVLAGIVWDNGHDPSALIEGFPGTSGPRPVRQGESIGVLRVTLINRGKVVIVGLDTTWTLTVKEPWR